MKLDLSLLKAVDSLDDFDMVVKFIYLIMIGSPSGKTTTQMLKEIMHKIIDMIYQEETK